MSYKYYEFDEIYTGVVDGTVLCNIPESERLNFLNFQIIATLADAGSGVDTTFTIERTNLPKVASSWITSGVSKAYNSAGAKNDMIEIPWGTAAAYRLKATVVQGTLSSVRIIACGKG